MYLPMCHIARFQQGAGKGKRVMGALPRGAQRAAIQAADAKAEAELKMAEAGPGGATAVEADARLSGGEEAHVHVSRADVRCP